MQKMPAQLRFIAPMECLEVDRIPEGDLWQYELKLDGYRTIALKQNREVHLFSRNGSSFNSKFPSVVQALETIRIKRFILDGEIVALDERGRHSFALLQKIKTSKAPLRFYVFDLLHIDNENLTQKILNLKESSLNGSILFMNLAKRLTTGRSKRHKEAMTFWWVVTFPAGTVSKNSLWAKNVRAICILSDLSRMDLFRQRVRRFSMR